MKKVILFLFLATLLVASASAYEFDNVKNYNEDTRTATFINMFGWGHTIAEATLISPSNVVTFYGKDRQVAEIKIDLYDVEYKDFAANMRFYDIKKNKKIDRGYTYKVKEISYKPLNIYQTKCEKTGKKHINGTDGINCYSYISQTEQQEVITWHELKPRDLKEGSVILGVFTDVQPGDYVEWIPNLFGVDITEWATWNDTFNIGLVSYHKFDNATRNATANFDSLGYTNASIKTATVTPGYGGLLGESWYYGGTDSGVAIYNRTQINQRYSFTYNAWFKITSSSNDMNVIARMTSGSRDIAIGLYGSVCTGNGKRPQVVYASASAPNTQACLMSDGDISDTTTWHMITVGHNTTAITLWVDGVYKGSAAHTDGVPTQALDLGVGDSVGGFWGTAWQGVIDEVGIWNYSLSNNLVTALWNGGAGMTYSSGVVDNPPTTNVTIPPSPANNSNFTISTITFNCSSNDDKGIINLTLNLNGYGNYTITNTTANQNLSLQTSIVLADGMFNYSCLASDGVASAITSAYNFTINSSSPPPTVTLNAPPSPTDTAKQASAAVILNCTAVDVNGVKNLTLNINGVDNYTISNTTIHENLSLQRSYSLADGAYSWYCRASNGVNIATSSTYSFTIDGTNPVANITTPASGTTYVTLGTNYNVTLNFYAYDNVGLSSCWYYNNTGYTSITCNANASLLFGSGTKNISYYVNDTLNNIASREINITIKTIAAYGNFTASSVEGEANTMYLNVTALDLSGFNATLTYNSTNHSMTLYNYDGSVASFNVTFITPPQSGDSSINLLFSYNVAGMALNTSAYTQQVYVLPSINVSSVCDNESYIFDLFDEQNLTRMEGTFSYTLYYGLGNSTFKNLYGTITGSNLSICINSTVSPTWIIGSGHIFYTSPGYVDRRYYFFDNTTLTTSPINVNLHDLETVEQTSFKLQVEDTSLNPYVNKLANLIRWYPGLNEYRVVDAGITDETGSTVLHVKTEDVDYRIGIYELNGTLIKLANPIRMVCLLSPCTYTLRISPTETDYNSFMNIQYTFTYNETSNIWLFTYADASLKTSTMNLTIWKDTGAANLAVCSAQTTGASGAVSCNTSGQTGSLRGEVYRSASPPILIVQKLVGVVSSAFKSSWGLWLSLLLAIPIIFLLAMVSPVAAVVGGIIALVPAFYFGSINIGILAGLAVMGGLVLHMLKRVS